MLEIELTTEERLSGKLSSTTVEAARKAVLEDGCVVLLDVIDPEHLAMLRDRMLEDLPTVLARTDTPFNFNRANVQQDPPPFAPYLFKDVLTNDYAIQVTQAVLGNGLRNGMYSGNTALPNSDQRQPAHADLGHLWPNMDHATPPYALVVNVPVVDMDERNGSTELWPGTHNDTSVAWSDGDIKVSDAKKAEWTAKRPPFQPKMRAGSILIRDIRMWHAGMPNRTDQPRPMIAMIHWVTWWPTTDVLEFAPEAEEVLKHPVLTTPASFVENPNYLGRHGAYDYTPTP